ncbi:MAG TPA: hypothetical protein VGZ04_06745 [Acidimicrobiales bacterium]|nr:hypothetical protein [Acidimicrobiales bacterium]
MDVAARVVCGQKASCDVLFSKWGETIAIAKPKKFATATSVSFPKFSC